MTETNTVQKSEGKKPRDQSQMISMRGDPFDHLLIEFAIASGWNGVRSKSDVLRECLHLAMQSEPFYAPLGRKAKELGATVRMLAPAVKEAKFDQRLIGEAVKRCGAKFAKKLNSRRR